MAKKVPVIVSLDARAVKELKEKGKITSCNNFVDTPPAIVKAITSFMVDNIGFDSGPIFCLTKFDGDTISLRSTDFSEETITDVVDLFVSGANNVIIEFSVESDSIASMDLSEFTDLCEQYRDLPDADEYIPDMVIDSLTIGTDIEDATVISFLPSLQLSDCTRYFRITEELAVDNKALFSNVEEVKIDKLNKFSR